MKLTGIENGLYIVVHDDGCEERLTAMRALQLPGWPESIKRKLLAAVGAMPQESVEVQALVPEQVETQAVTRRRRTSK